MVKYALIISVCSTLETAVSSRGRKCGTYTYSGFGRLFVPTYMRTDLNWEFKALTVLQSGALHIHDKKPRLT